MKYIFGIRNMTLYLNERINYLFARLQGMFRVL